MTRERLGHAGFLGFLATQALGAFNDNAFRFTMLFAIRAAVDGPDQSRLTGAAQVLFAVPFVLFAAWSGTLADHFGKSRIIVLAKVTEILVMLLGVLAFASGSSVGLLCVLFLMSTQSTFFGPAKYGWVAETVPEKNLARANGLVQMTTMVAIVSGQVFGGDLFESYRDDLSAGAWIFVAVAALGAVTACLVTRVPASRPQAAFSKNPFGDLKETWSVVRTDRRLLYTVMGIGHFFLLSALLQIDLLVYGEDLLGLGDAASARLVATAVVGIAVGSVLAGRLSGGRVEVGLVPLGAFAMGLGIFALALCEPVPVDIQSITPGGLADELFLRGFWAPILLVFLTGLAGGLFIVPLYAMLQLLAPAGQKGRFLAFGNMVSFVGIGIASVFIWLPAELGLSIRTQFLMIAVLSLVGTVGTLRVFPEACIRFVAWILTHSVFRFRVRSEDRVPERGGALLVASPVSQKNVLMLVASSRRRLHFIMSRRHLEGWAFRRFFRLLGGVSIGVDDTADAFEASQQMLRNHLDEGRLVVILGDDLLGEGDVDTPLLQTTFKRLTQGLQGPIIPVHLGGSRESTSEASDVRRASKRRRVLPAVVHVIFGEPLPPDSSLDAVDSARRALHAPSA